MGQVYRATDTRLKRQVAIKVLPPSVARDHDRLARFQREAQVLASVNHPNIGAIYGVENDGDVHALVLELVEGQTLAEKLRSQGLKGIRLDEALAIARQLADALDAAHERGIVHRDLKPANIALSPDGVVKVLDFGLAKVGTGEESDESANSTTMMAPTVGGMLLGTAPYMSPEQARGKAADKRTDIWAFGCVLYEMLAGRRAFDGETSSDAIAAILEREPDYSRLNASTPPHIVRLMRRMLDKDPKSRLRDIGDARAEFDATPDPRLPGPVPRTPSPPLFRERLAWSALVVAAAGAAALAVMVLRTVPPAASAVMFDAPFPPGLAATFAQLAVSPDGRYLAVAPTFEGRAPIWLRPIDSSAGRILPGTEGATFPFWSPDGTSIGFFAEQKLKRIEIDGEAVSIVTDAPIARGGMWEPDGTILFAPRPVGPLFRVPYTGGTAVAATTLEPGQNDHRAPFLLPDGRHFLYYSRGTAQVRGVYVARLDGSESRRLADADAAAVYASGHLLFVRQNELFAQPFDADRLILGSAGTAFRVAGPVAINPAISLASLAAAPAGAIAYAASNIQSGQFVWVDRTGATIEALGQPVQTPIAMASLSPDGRRIAFSRVVGGNWDIWLMDMRGAMNRFTTDPALDFSPIWSADGRQIFFQSPRVLGPAPNLYVRSVTDGTPEELLLKSELPKLPTDVSADGRQLLYTVNTGTSSEIWSFPLAGDRTPRVFVKSLFNARDGQFSPDGKWVAYQSDESGRNEIYLQPFPGPGERIQLSPGGGTQVRWGHQSAEVFYIAADQRLNAVPVRIAANSVLSVGSPKPLFHVSAIQQLGLQYVVSADGQRFLLNTQTADSPSITMILNWKGKQ